MRVTTYDPFRQFEQAFRSLPRAAAADSGSTIPFDVLRGEEHVTLSFDLPGFTADTIDLTVEKRELVLRAERPEPDTESAELVRSERRYGSFERRLLLAENLDSEDLSAQYVDGVLTVTIPVVAEAKPRRIEIS